MSSLSERGTYRVLERWGKLYLIPESDAYAIKVEALEHDYLEVDTEVLERHAVLIVDEAEATVTKNTWRDE